MLFLELAENLIYGELSSMHFAQGDTSALQEKDLKRMLHFTNDALLDIYSRVPLQVESLTLETFEDQSDYLLTEAFAESNKQSKEIRKYIKDTESKPFIGNILKILAVKNANGCNLPLNDLSRCDSVFTPLYNVLQVTHPSDEVALEVIFTGRHKKLEYFGDRLKLFGQNINLPVQLNEALNLKISSRYYSGMSGQEVSNKTRDMIERYEMLCEKVKMENKVNLTRLSTPTSLESRGFV